MSKTVTIQVDCPQCGGIRNKMLSEKDKWDNDNAQYFKVGKFQCLSCDKKFTYTYGIKEE